MSKKTWPWQKLKTSFFSCRVFKFENKKNSEDTLFLYVLGSQNLENGGIDCYTGCNQQQGKCDWCGMDGWCCRKGIDWVGNGCDGTFGGPSSHRCVLKPGMYLLNLS